MLTNTFNKITRRGKVLRVVKEHYVRDDIPCGLADCSKCPPPVPIAPFIAAATSKNIISDSSPSSSSLASSSSADTMPVLLSQEPFGNQFVVLDTNTVLHQMDVLEAANGILDDVIILQTVLEETKHRHTGIYNRLRALMQRGSSSSYTSSSGTSTAGRRFVAFANVHHRDTYSKRLPGETANDYNDRLIRDACKWLSNHFADMDLQVLLVTHDKRNAQVARKEVGLTAATLREYIQNASSVVSSVTGKTADYSKLLELVAAPGQGFGKDGEEEDAADDEGDMLNHGGAATSALEATAEDVASRGKRGNSNSNNKNIFSMTMDGAGSGSKSQTKAAVGIGATSSTTTSNNKRSASAPSRGATRVVSKSGAVYREHYSQQQLTEGMKARRMFQGVLRVSRDCWYEARVMIHGIQGKGGRSSSSSSSSSLEMKETGAEDVLSVLLVGREALNRGMDGDTVVIELLPQSQWKHPSTRLAQKPAKAEDEDAVERKALKEAGEEEANSTASASTSSITITTTATTTTTTTKAPTQLALAATAASTASSGGSVPTGRVLGVLKRAWRPLCGSLEAEEPVLPGASANDGSLATQTAIFVPVDSRFPRVRIETRQKWSLMDKRLVVALDSWDTYSKFPRGHYVRTIGKIGEKAAENEVILLEHDIASRPFSSDVIACLPPADFTITAENSKGRVDLRREDIDVCSIDPPGCKDIDDALHARYLRKAGVNVTGIVPIQASAAAVTDTSSSSSDGNHTNHHHHQQQHAGVDLQATTDDDIVEIGVHIADVTYFVRHGTAIDNEAALRANTTYLVEKRLDMLPGLLTETLCSLKQHVDRFAFSVVWLFRRPKPLSGSIATNNAVYAPQYMKLSPEDRWEMVPNSAQFFKSIIHSRSAMTYAAAQALLDDKKADSKVAQGVKLLASVARSLRRGRIEAGALALASAEVKFLLDSETHEPLDVTAYEMRETNNTVEEFMLLGNVAVGERILQSYPRCSLLRRHPAPPKSAFNSLLAAAKAVGVTLDTTTSKSLADSLDTAVVADNPYFNRLLRILATRCMMQAAYFPSGETAPAEYHHYGLAAPIYTHFTSPIRRYADVVVHRCLAAALGVDPLPHEYQDKVHLHALAENMNKRHLMSQLAGRASGSLHTNIYFNRRIVIETGLVMRIRANGIVVLIPRFGIEGGIMLGKAKGEGGESTADAASISTVTSSSGYKSSLVSNNNKPSRILEYDEEAQVIYDIASPTIHKIRIFQEVRIALIVEEKARHRRELVYKVVDPPFEPIPVIPGAVEGGGEGKKKEKDDEIESGKSSSGLASSNIGAGGGGGGQVVDVLVVGNKRGRSGK